MENENFETKSLDFDENKIDDIFNSPSLGILEARSMMPRLQGPCFIDEKLECIQEDTKASVDFKANSLKNGKNKSKNTQVAKKRKEKGFKRRIEGQGLC